MALTTALCKHCELRWICILLVLRCKPKFCFLRQQHKFSGNSVPVQWRARKQSSVVFNYQPTLIPGPLLTSSLTVAQSQSYYHRSACRLVQFDSKQQGRDSVSLYLDRLESIVSDIHYLQACSWCCVWLIYTKRLSLLSLSLSLCEKTCKEKTYWFFVHFIIIVIEMRHGTNINLFARPTCWHMFFKCELELEVKYISYLNFLCQKLGVILGIQRWIWKQ